MSRKGQPFVPGSRPIEHQRISSDSFSAKAVREASVNLAVRECRGNTQLVPDYRGIIAAQVNGGRVIR